MIAATVETKNTVHSWSPQEEDVGGLGVVPPSLQQSCGQVEVYVQPGGAATRSGRAVV